MNYSTDDIMSLAKEISIFKEINISDIPCVDLYMDQVTTLFEDKLSHLKRNVDETILTKTMINNYAKAKILTPIKNKKYSKTQIMLLILIYNLKQTLSLDDIKSLLNPIIENLNESTNLINDDFDKLYDAFLTIKNTQNETFEENLLSSIDSLKNTCSNSSEEDESVHFLLLTVLSLINSANLQKRMAEKIIDSYFKNKE